MGKWVSAVIYQVAKLPIYQFTNLPISAASVSERIRRQDDGLAVAESSQIRADGRKIAYDGGLEAARIAARQRRDAQRQLLRSDGTQPADAGDLANRFLNRERRPAGLHA